MSLSIYLLQPALTETKYWNEFVRTKADEVENKND